MARILVVEDEPAIAAVVAEWLDEIGHRIIGPAADIETALKVLADEGVDMALLDVNLAGLPVGLQLAEMLEAQRIPLAFITGYAASLFPVGLREYPRLEKPFGRSQLLSVVEEMQSLSEQRR